MSQEEDFNRLLEYFNRRSGIDLSSYSREFLRRRVDHRCQQSGIRRYSDYLSLVLKNSEERENFVKSLSIEVTEFFRDRDFYLALESKVFPEIIAGKDPSGKDTIKAWSAACATGQEPYSLAMTLDHYLKKRAPEVTYQVLASDINERFLEIARKAEYSSTKLTKMPKAYRAAYVSDEGDCSRISREIRHSVHFFKYDLTSLQPATGVDLILCRYVLIYMSPESRRQIIEAFGSSLKTGGFLILGSSEAIVKSDVFETVDTKNSIYRRTAAPAPARNETASFKSESSDSAPAFKLRGPNAKNLIVIGASTGGIKMVKSMLSKMPADLNAAILVAQHLSPEFSESGIAALSKISNLPATIAQDGELLEKGRVYFTPADKTVQIMAARKGARCGIIHADSPHRINPWIDLTMKSAAEVFGAQCIGVLLSGIGSDGAEGMKAVQQAGGTTYAQDEASSMVFGMAEAAIRLGVVDYVMPPERLWSSLVRRVADA